MIVAIIWISTSIAVCFAIYFLQEPLALLTFFIPLFSTSRHRIEFDEPKTEIFK